MDSADRQKLSYTDDSKTGEEIADVDSSAPLTTLGNAKKETTSPSEGSPTAENSKMLSDNDLRWLERLKTNMLNRGRNSIMRNLKDHLKEIPALTVIDLEKIEEFRETSEQQIDIIIDVIASKSKYVLEEFCAFMKKYDFGHLLPDQMEDSTRDGSDSESGEHEPVYPIDCSGTSDVPTFSQSPLVPDPSQVAGTRPAESKSDDEKEPIEETEIEAAVVSHPIPFQQQILHVPRGAEGGIQGHMARESDIISLLQTLLITKGLLLDCPACLLFSSNAYCESAEDLHSNCVLPVQVSPPLMIPNAQTSEMEFFEEFLLPSIVQLYIESIRKYCSLEKIAICSIFWVDLRKFHSGPGHFCYLRLFVDPIANKSSPRTLEIAGIMARVPIKEQCYERLTEKYYYHDPSDEDSIIRLWHEPEWSSEMPRKLYSSMEEYYNITFNSPHESLGPVFEQLRKEAVRQLGQTLDTIYRTLSDLVSKVCLLI